MIDCLVIGDQIANGMIEHVRGCALVSAPGITSKDFLNTHSKSHLIYNNEWDTVIICLGVNDNPNSVRILNDLREIRNGITAKNVYWMLPPESMFDIRNAVHDAAMGRQDMIIDVVGWNKNTVTPRGYKEAADKLR